MGDTGSNLATYAVISRRGKEIVNNAAEDTSATLK